MKGEQSAETPVGVPASVVWEAYRGLELGRLVDQLLPEVVGKVEVLEGDGGVGTIVKLTFPSGTPGSGYMKEIFRKVDDEKRVKITQVIEGGYLDFGFDVFKVKLEIIEKDDHSSIIKSTVEYEILDDTKLIFFLLSPLTNLSSWLIQLAIILPTTTTNPQLFESTHLL